jgi:hypothetical protein
MTVAINLIVTNSIIELATESLSPFNDVASVASVASGKHKSSTDECVRGYMSDTPDHTVRIDALYFPVATLATSVTTTELQGNSVAKLKSELATLATLPVSTLQIRFAGGGAA